MDRRHEALTCVAEDVHGRSWSLTHRWKASLLKLAGLSFDAFTVVTLVLLRSIATKAAGRVRGARYWNAPTRYTRGKRTMRM